MAKQERRKTDDGYGRSLYGETHRCRDTIALQLPSEPAACLSRPPSPPLNDCHTLADGGRCSKVCQHLVAAEEVPLIPGTVATTLSSVAAHGPASLSYISPDVVQSAEVSTIIGHVATVSGSTSVYVVAGASDGLVLMNQEGQTLVAPVDDIYVSFAVDLPFRSFLLHQRAALAVSNIPLYARLLAIARRVASCCLRLTRGAIVVTARRTCVAVSATPPKSLRDDGTNERPHLMTRASPGAAVPCGRI